MTRRSSHSDLPLLAWGDELRRKAHARRRLRRRTFAGGIGIGLLLGSAMLPPEPRLLWNASASAPIGLYAVTPGAPVHTGDMVIARMPAPVRRLAAERRYIPINVPLVKRVAAEPGDTVCALGQAIFVNSQRVAARRLMDGRGRAMPWWKGCITLRAGTVFLLMADSPDSFDGRYFGPTSSANVVGKARLLWRR